MYFVSSFCEFIMYILKKKKGAKIVPPWYTDKTDFTAHSCPFIVSFEHNTNSEQLVLLSTNILYFA